MKRLTTGCGLPAAVSHTSRTWFTRPLVFAASLLALAACYSPRPLTQEVTGAKDGQGTPRSVYPVEVIDLDGEVVGPRSPDSTQVLPGDSPRAGYGSVSITIRWPRTVQAIPKRTKAIRVEILENAVLLKDTDGKDVAAEAVRADGEATSSVQLEVPPGGPYDLVAGAYSDATLRTASALVASATRNFVVRSNERLALKLALTPLPNFPAAGFRDPGPLELYVPSPRGVIVKPAGFLTSKTLEVVDPGTGETLLPSWFSWQSSNDAVATVDSNGNVTAVSGAASPIEIRAVALHSSAVMAIVSVRVRDEGNVDVEVE